MAWYYTGTVTEKGEVLSGPLTDQFREGCRFYNRLWKEGIFCKQMVGSEGSTLNPLSIRPASSPCPMSLPI